MRKPHTGSAMPDRRSIVLGGAAPLGTTALPDPSPAALPVPRAAPDAGLAPAAAFLAATRKCLASLEPDKQRAASFAWNAREWTGWNYFGATGFIKPGLRLEQMSEAQKGAAWDIVA